MVVVVVVSDPRGRHTPYIAHKHTITNVNLKAEFITVCYMEHIQPETDKVTPIVDLRSTIQRIRHPAV